jgi:hypothetical protein
MDQREWPVDQKVKKADQKECQVDQVETDNRPWQLDQMVLLWPLKPLLLLLLMERRLLVILRPLELLLLPLELLMRLLLLPKPLRLLLLIAQKRVVTPWMPETPLELEMLLRKLKLLTQWAVNKLLLPLDLMRLLLLPTPPRLLR